MESLRRPIVYQGVTYPKYEMDGYTSNVYGKRFKDKDRALKPRIDNDYFDFCISIEGRTFNARQHQLLVETFPDLISKSPLVSHYSLQRGQDRHELKTPMGFSFICNQVCPDHINNNKRNNHHTNLMLATQFENILKCGPRKGGKYKGITKTPFGKCQVRTQWRNILDKNGKEFYISKNFKTEEEAALGYNTMLEEALLTIWGPDLGPKMYDFAYKNVIETPIQEQLILR